MFNFIGIGSAFNTRLGNTSAFIKKGNSLFLIDCGGTTFHRIQELDLLKGIENLYIAITHTHPDHIGSLGEVIFYAYYILNIKPTIFYPRKSLLKDILTNIGVENIMYNLSSSNAVTIEDKKLGQLGIEFINVSHVSTIPAYGIMVKYNDKLFYYSGDSNDIDKKIIDKLISGEIYRVYQDTSGLDYKDSNHLSLKKLCEKVPNNIRNKVFCMHLDKHIDKDEIKCNGFSVVKIFKENL